MSMAWTLVRSALLLLLLAAPPAWPAPPTCYSRMLSLSREVTGDFQRLLAAESQEPCVRYLPKLYLDIHLLPAAHSQNYCVLAKLRDFVASPQCWKMAQADALKEKVRKLYTIMNLYCRRDLVFLSDDCGALEYPIPVTTILPDHQR
ncbi:cytokine-like protein 1 isoform X1 [Nycticebus coucang]|uniref:cytokine-like protein 1 isoform X1 n=1 Tax=Nycticebus coucang TaxID=9470 RepID=UPI00234C282D|nr:cytokine-like protein 1 isoform X1 [Nycticebus coucang]